MEHAVIGGRAGGSVVAGVSNGTVKGLFVHLEPFEREGILPGLIFSLATPTRSFI